MSEKIDPYGQPLRQHSQDANGNWNTDLWYPPSHVETTIQGSDLYPETPAEMLARVERLIGLLQAGREADRAALRWVLETRQKAIETSNTAANQLEEIARRLNAAADKLALGQMRHKDAHLAELRRHIAALNST